ncbi:hypothetical protein [Nocardiopsis aegyptia]|uniref:Diketogulonate reductase-like aldo/keto reductase n=1 Tax=Nocardiopsis aegyptia TaxID=220378 RepID=A0A7Z0ERB4_9ACTN|nr:hypothetical protein [Nocardiopsis aegyptia]NYJ36851.1 diketogulonate reductase-like aldo/keto reductase [Nocardiopsis aegyptia]
MPIPGTKSPRRLADNAAAPGIGLDENQLADLDALAEHVTGSRRPVLPPELRALMPDDHGEHAAA